MIEQDPSRRPTARMVLHHPFFWDDDKRLAFLVDFSDRLELEPPSSLLVLAVESGAAEVVGRAWDVRLDTGLLADVNRYRKYDTASVRDCLRILRNKRHHFHELPVEVQRLMAPLPGGLYRYFQARYDRSQGDIYLPIHTPCLSILSHPTHPLTHQGEVHTPYPPPPPPTHPPTYPPTTNRFPRLLMHCHGVCTRLLTRDKIFRTYMGKELCEDYEEDNASIHSLSSPVPVAVPTPQAEAEEGNPPPSLPPAAAAARPDEGLLSQVVVFAGGNLATSYGCRGWWRPADHWERRQDAGKVKVRPPHLTRMLTDPKYRTRLCQHWETSSAPVPGVDGSGVPVCPMKKKNKCDFAHAVIELRVKENRRGKWGLQRELPGVSSMRTSGGEDVLAQARVAERSRGASVGGGGGGGERRARNASSSSSAGEGLSTSRSSVATPPPQQQQQPSRGGGGMDDGPWRRGMQVERGNAAPQQSSGGGGGGGGGGSFADVLKKRAPE